MQTQSILLIFPTNDSKFIIIKEANTRETNKLPQITNIRASH